MESSESRRQTNAAEKGKSGQGQERKRKATSELAGNRYTYCTEEHYMV